MSVASATLSTMSITFCIAADGPATKSPIAACARPVSWRTCARSRLASSALRIGHDQIGELQRLGQVIEGAQLQRLHGAG